MSETKNFLTKKVIIVVAVLAVATNQAQAFIRRAAKEGLIERIQGESEHGHFRPVYNKITEKGRELLVSTLQ